MLNKNIKELEKKYQRICSEKIKLESTLLILKRDIYYAKLEPFKKPGYKYHLCNGESPSNTVGGKMAKGWVEDREASKALGSPIVVMRIHKNKKERILK